MESTFDPTQAKHNRFDYADRITHAFHANQLLSLNFFILGIDIFPGVSNLDFLCFFHQHSGDRGGDGDELLWELEEPESEDESELECTFC